MLWIKAFHIIFVVSWFAGLFYLPRLFVNHAMVEDPVTAERLKLMEHKLYRFMTPLGVLALSFGIWLWLGYGFSGGWLHVKLALVTLLARLPPLLRQDRGGFQKRPQPSRPCILSLDERTAGADSDGRGDPGGGQAVLRLVNDRPARSASDNAPAPPRA